MVFQSDDLDIIRIHLFQLSIIVIDNRPSLPFVPLLLSCDSGATVAKRGTKNQTESINESIMTQADH